jgi:hypothetical protein
VLLPRGAFAGFRFAIVFFFLPVLRAGFFAAFFLAFAMGNTLVGVML